MISGSRPWSNGEAMVKKPPNSAAEVSREAEVKALQNYPQLGAWLWRLPEPKDGPLAAQPRAHLGGLRGGLGFFFQGQKKGDPEKHMG